MRTPPAGTVAEIIATQGIDALRGVSIAAGNGPSLYIANKLIDKILKERADDGDHLGKTAWRERLYGGETPDAELVVHIYPAASRVKSPHLLQARILENAAEALRGVEMEQIRGHLVDGARTIRSMVEQKPDLCLVVLTEGGVMEQYQTGSGPALTDTIDCQNGAAGQIMEVGPAYLPLLAQAFGPKEDWPSFIHISHETDVNVQVCLADDAGNTVVLSGIYNDQSFQLTLGNMHPDDGYRAQFGKVQSVRFDDPRGDLVAGDAPPLHLWDFAPYRWDSKGVNSFALDKPLQEMLTPESARLNQSYRGQA